MPRNWRLYALVGLSCVPVWACSPTANLSATGPAQPPHAPNCEFALLTVPPATGYFEIGALDISQGFTGKLYTEVDELKGAIRTDVCKTGGDAAIAFANGYGEYIKVTILKRGADAAPGPTPASSTAPLPAAAPVVTNAAVPTANPAQDLGCHYDTQCKGDRVCTDGKCVPPSEPTAPRVVAAPPPSAPAPPPASLPPAKH